MGYDWFEDRPEYCCNVGYLSKLIPQTYFSIAKSHQKFIYIVYHILYICHIYAYNYHAKKQHTSFPRIMLLFICKADLAHTFLWLQRENIRYSAILWPSGVMWRRWSCSSLGQVPTCRIFHNQQATCISWINAIRQINIPMHMQISKS